MSFKHIVDVARLVLAIYIISILSVSMVNAAVISGTIYDLALQKEYDIVVEIDTMPNQLMVSKDGYYSFNVNPGNYILHAYTSTSEATEPIMINDDGDYNLDIVLEDKVLNPLDSISFTDSGINISSSLPKNGISTLVWVLAGIVILMLIILLALYLLVFRGKHGRVKHAKHADGIPVQEQEKAGLTDEYEHKILNIIRKEKRTTQKDVRKEIPLSEAKISLILTDLEDKGKIRKIKKGRGNVLIFVKD